MAAVISSRYPFVRFPLEASSHNGIARGAVERACSSIIRLRRGWSSLYSHLASMLTLLEPSSPNSSDHPLEDDIRAQMPPGSSPAISLPSDAPPVIFIPEAPAQEHPATVESPQGRSIFKKWLQKMSNKSQGSHKLRRSGKSREPVDRQSPSHSPARVDNRQEGPSRMAASRPKTVSAVP